MADGLCARPLATHVCYSDDAAAAIDNMNHAELYGRVLRCNYAQPAKGPAGRAVWAEAGADTYMERLDEEAAKEAADG